jgi:hypothetical protein
MIGVASQSTEPARHGLTLIKLRWFAQANIGRRNGGTRSFGSPEPGVGFMKRSSLLFIIPALALAACAGSKRVTEKTSPQELGPDVGYVAFHYERADKEVAEIHLRHAATGKDYSFRLDRPSGSLYFAIAAWKVYEKSFGDTTTPTLVVIPLPAGEYDCRLLRLEVEQPDWKALLLQMPPARASRSLKGRTLSVALDTVTYIGTYRTRARAKFFGGIDYEVEVIDDGEERAARLGIQRAFRKQLLAIK